MRAAHATAGSALHARITSLETEQLVPSPSNTCCCIAIHLVICPIHVVISPIHATI